MKINGKKFFVDEQDLEITNPVEKSNSLPSWHPAFLPVKAEYDKVQKAWIPERKAVATMRKSDVSIDKDSLYKSLLKIEQLINEIEKGWVTINGAHILIGEGDEAGGGKGGSRGSLKSQVQDLHDKAVAQNASFQASAAKVAASVNGKAEHGPVKKTDRMMEKLDEYPKSKDVIKNLKDTNRATILVNDPADLSRVVEATKNEYGNVDRVKDKFGYEGYRSAIINVEGDKGVMGEIAVTTPEMWEAKTTGGGDAMYNVVRSGQDEVGAFKVAMGNLYANAQMATNRRLGH